MIKISVITAVYNGEKTIRTAIESVLSQSYINVESIVIDGCSTDGTLALLDSYKTKLCRIVSEPDSGIYDALNKGILCSSGDVVGFMHSDDIFENKWVLEKVAAVFQDPTVEAVYGDLVYVKHNDLSKVIRYWKSGNYNSSAFSRGWMPPHPTFYARRSVFNRLGKFDTRYRISADYDMVLRFLAVGQIRAIYIPDVLVRMRVGGISNRSLRTIIRKTIEDLNILRRNKIGGIVTLLFKNLRKLSQFLHR